MSALPIIAIRQDYLKICDGDHCAAAILNAFEFWSRGKRRKGVTGDVWIYKKQSELRVDLAGMFGLNKISASLRRLRDLGFLAARSNPHNGQDKTLQYRFEWEAVEVAISGFSVVQKSKPETTEIKPEALKLKPETLIPSASYTIIDKQKIQPEKTTEQAASKTPTVPNVLSPAPAAAAPIPDSGEFVSGIIQEGQTHGDERNEPVDVPGYDDVPAWAQEFQAWNGITQRQATPPPVPRPPSPDELARVRKFLPTMSRAAVDDLLKRHGTQTVLDLITEAETGAAAGRVRNPQGVVIAGLRNMGREAA